MIPFGTFGKFKEMRISFGPFAFDRQSRLLWRDGAEIALPPRVLGVLELLIDRAGQVVARQDLLDGVWKDAFVTDTSLAEAVSFLRQALGDDPQAPRYIQTVHRRGYRFLAPIIAEAPAPAAAPAAPDWGLTPETHFAGETGARAPSATSEVVKPSIAWQLLPWSVAVLCTGLAVAAAWQIARQPAPLAPPIVRFVVQPVTGTAFDVRSPAIAVSADGAMLAWSACDDRSHACALYTRAIDRLQTARISGTDGARSPFFSPDGRWIGFFADGKLKKIAVAGGTASILADAPAPGGATWASDGRIAFAGAAAGGLSIVSDQGGPVTALTTPRAERGEVRHLYPAWLPSGGLIFTILSTTLPDAPGELAVVPPQAHDWRTLRAGVSRAAPAGPGYLLLSSGTDLQAATFDERVMTLTGGSDSVLASVSGDEGIAHFAIGGGTLVAIPAGARVVARWSDAADGTPIARLSSITISRDSRRAAGVVPDGAGSDIWIADLASGALTRMTYGGSNVSPAWSADGTRLFFATRSSGPFTIASRRIDEGSLVPLVATGAAQVFPASVAPDGRVAVTVVAGGGRTAAGIVPATGGAVQILPAGPFDEAGPVFSPDGRWVALESSESGRVEVVLRDVRGGRRIPVSSDGATHPRWSADGRWIYFDSGPRLMRAPFDAGTTSAGPPEMVRDAPGPGSRVFAVTPSGRLLIADGGGPADHAFVIVQWVRDLRQRLPQPVTAPR